MNGKYKRISKATAVGMALIAGLFDLFQIAAKLFIIFGLTVVGTVGGGAIGDFFGLGEVGAWIGGLVGAGLTLVGIGVAVGIIMSEVSGWLLAAGGWTTMYFWFQLKGVPIMGGPHTHKRFTIAILSFLADLVPFFNILPGLTMWTCYMIRFTWQEDKAATEAAQVRYNGMNTRRMATDRRHATKAEEQDNDVFA